MTKKFINLFLLLLIVRVYSGGFKIGEYKVSHMRDIRVDSSGPISYYIECIDKPRNCGVKIMGPAVLVIEEGESK